MGRFEQANGEKLEQRFISQPDNPYKYSVKWDGEWQVTYETFRDMGLAFEARRRAHCRPTGGDGW